MTRVEPFAGSVLIVDSGMRSVGGRDLGYLRILTLPWTFAQTITSPLMPAYGEARARCDWSWIRRAFARSFLTSAASGIVLTTLWARRFKSTGCSRRRHSHE